MYVCVHVCMYVWMYVHVHNYVWIYVCTYMYVIVCVHVYVIIMLCEYLSNFETSLIAEESTFRGSNNLITDTIDKMARGINPI